MNISSPPAAAHCPLLMWILTDFLNLKKTVEEEVLWLILKKKLTLRKEAKPSTSLSDRFIIIHLVL